MIGLIERERFLGRYWQIQLTPAFYRQLDHQIMGWNTIADAVTVARFLLDKNSSGAASELHRRTGWDKRRFNPALRVVTDLLPKSRVSEQLQPDYAAAFVSVIPEDRGALRRFIASAGGA